MPRMMVCTAGWAASPWMRRATWRSGYSVVNGRNVFPGIRYTGRLAGDRSGQMTLGEGTIIDGTGVQTNHQLALGRLHVHECRSHG